MRHADTSARAGLCVGLAARVAGEYSMFIPRQVSTPRPACGNLLLRRTGRERYSVVEYFASAGISSRICSSVVWLSDDKC